MELKLGHIEVFVTDPLRSKDFYVDVLGFGLEIIQQNKIVWLHSGAYTLLLRPGNKIQRGADYQSAEKAFVLYTDNLDETKTILAKKGLVFKGTDGSDRCLTFTDPDGNWFQLVDPKEH
jgi:catechol 2,3-dioxygenase-like lactoylglutathione lyase family enzyme